MKLVQTSTSLKTKGVLSIDDKTFVELLDEKDGLLSLKLSYDIVVTAAGTNIDDYEKVVITVKSPEASSFNTDLFQASPPAGAKYKSNSSIDDGTYAVSLADAANSVSYPQNIAEKVFAGKILLASLKSKKKYVARKISDLGSQLRPLLDRTFSTVELVKLPVKNVASSDYTANSVVFDVRNSSYNINRFRCDITSPASESYNSKTDLSTCSVPRGKPSFEEFYKDLLKYYLLGVKSSPLEDLQVHYEPVQKVKKLTQHRFSEVVQVPAINKHVNLDVTFELYRRNSYVPDEVAVATVNVSRLYSALRVISAPPHVIANFVDNVVYATVESNDVNVGGYNFYAKKISPSGDVGDYVFVGTKSGSRFVVHNFKFEDALSILRVVPYDLEGNESHVHTSVVVGNSYKALGNLTICPRYNSSGDRVVIDLINIPKDASKVFLYRRNCSDNVETSYELAMEVSLFNNVNNYKIYDPLGTVPGSIFEYYCKVSLSEEDAAQSMPLVSNYVLFRHPLPQFQKNAVAVTIGDFSSKVQATGEFTIEFNLTSKVSREEKALVTQALKDQLGELYEQYLNPANNAASPLTEEKYADLIIHEIVRSNLSTGERETFDLVTDGRFYDNENTQRVANIKPLNPLHTYRYQVFSYRKNPLLLFRNYVAYGVDVIGNEWFYLPFKWRQASVVATGRLYPDDSNGYPIVDGYESLTSESLGLTASHTYSGVIELTKVEKVVAERIDVDTVVIRWDFSSTITDFEKSLYDSFVVMKVVNGVRSFVGRSFKNFIYHELTSADLGTVYYMIVPIMKDMNIGEPNYSNSLFIDAPGLTNNFVVSNARNSK